MLEVDIDLSTQQPQRLTLELARAADLLITMGCGEACPHVPGLRKEDWPLPDPKGQGLEAVRETRNRIKELVLDLLHREGWLGLGVVGATAGGPSVRIVTHTC